MDRINQIKLSHDSFVSLHVQLRTQVRQLILSGRWAPGGAVPSENQLSRTLNISRTTVRLALQQLELEGLIARVPGKGTFVADRGGGDAGTRLLAFVTCGFDDAEALDLLKGAELEARANGYGIVFSHVRHSRDEAAVIKRLQEDGTAGALLWPNLDEGQSAQRRVDAFQQITMPLVFIDRDIPGVERDLITSDNIAGARALMFHLVELGHRHIVYLSHPMMSIRPVAERYNAYRDVMREAGLTPVEPWLIGHEGRETVGHQALRASLDSNSLEFQQLKDHVLNASTRPTAIVAVNDYTAVLAMRVLKFLNIRVPESMSITGFDDIDLAVHLETPLTTVAQDHSAISRLATRVLIDRLQGDTQPARTEVVPVGLRLRSSTTVPVQVTGGA
ncbi:MAG TPA: GntR family transcriptional regulator [Anaerolineales bacterium]|nr:GntR family transcriptional regulator [Anaerolineales bacterium]HRF48409.1 GntR family transcriptional regulator [Anaerolineales bacterium]